MQLYGFFYVHLSGQRRTGLERLNSSMSAGTMVHGIFFNVFFAVTKNLKLSFSEDNMPVHVLDVFIKTPPKWFELSH